MLCHRRQNEGARDSGRGGGWCELPANLRSSAKPPQPRPSVAPPDSSAESGNTATSSTYHAPRQNDVTPAASSRCDGRSRSGHAVQTSDSSASDSAARAPGRAAAASGLREASVLVARPSAWWAAGGSRRAPAPAARRRITAGVVLFPGTVAARRRVWTRTAARRRAHADACRRAADAAGDRMLPARSMRASLLAATRAQPGWATDQGMAMGPAWH